MTLCVCDPHAKLNHGAIQTSVAYARLLASEQVDSATILVDTRVAPITHVLMVCPLMAWRTQVALEVELALKQSASQGGAKVCVRVCV